MKVNLKMIYLKVEEGLYIKMKENMRGILKMVSDMA